METTSEHKFRIKRSTSVSAIGLPFAIITTGFSGHLHRKLWGEYYLFVSGQTPYFACQRVFVNIRRMCPQGLVNFDQDFMHAELEQQISGKSFSVSLPLLYGDKERHIS